MKSIHDFMTATFQKFGLIEPNRDFNPTMVQRPMIGLGDTARYSLEMQMVAFNSPARGTIAPNSPSSGKAFIDVNQHVVGPTQGFNTIPNTPRSQGLVLGFREE